MPEDCAGFSSKTTASRKFRRALLTRKLQTAYVNLNKKKAQITEIRRMSQKLESQRSSCSQRIEKIKEQQSSTSNVLAEYDVKTSVLNRELMELLESEKVIANETEESLRKHENSTEEPFGSLILNLIESLQVYKVAVSKGICHIIDRILLKNFKMGHEITSSYGLELQCSFKKLQQELEAISEYEIYQITKTEELIADKKFCIKDKQALIKSVEEQQRSMPQLMNLTDTVLAERTNISIRARPNQSSSKKGHNTSLNLDAINPVSSVHTRTASNSSITSARRIKATLKMDVKPSFPERRVKPRDRTKSFHGNFDLLSSGDQHSVSESDFNHCGSTDVSSSRSIKRMQSMAHLSHHHSMINSSAVTNITLASSSTSMMKSPSVAHIDLSNRNSIFDCPESEQKNKLPNQSSTKRFDVESHLCSTQKDDIDKASRVMENGVLLLKKFSSNNGLSVTRGATVANSGRKGKAGDISKYGDGSEPKGYGRRVIKVNKMNRTLEIYKFKQRFG